MFSLNIIPKNLEVKSSDISNTKYKSQKTNKDFLQILEGQKDKFNNTNIEAKEEINSVDTIKKENNRNYEIQGKSNRDAKKLNNLENLEELDEIEIQVMAIFQSLYSLFNLLQDLNVESNELKESIFSTIGLEIEETLSLLEKLMDNNLFLSEEEFSIEIENKIENFIQVMEMELEEYKTINENQDGKLPIEESLEQLNEGLNHLKLIVVNNSNKPIENSIEIPEELEENDLVENFPVDVESITEKNSLINEEKIELDFTMEKELETKDIDNSVPSFEIKNKTIIKETNPLETEKSEYINSKKVIEQIVDKAKITINDFKQEIKISLKPEILGELILKMEVEKGNLLTKIMVDNYRTKELIEANLYQLKQEMKENGLEIKTFEVFVGTNEDFQRE
ncbi:MAG: flagellar hook-length control protein FliK, partial [Tissierellia bacterium]|nr:flagellar hook-length control protein FliK [Tissierellia bacterium]